eukprot:983762-Karenia_brevis.AAC.1
MGQNLAAARDVCSAEDGRFLTSSQAEFATLTQSPLVGGALDLHKCFDQVLRPLFYMVLLLAGLPPCILVPCMNFLENVSVYNCFSGSVGLPHKHAAVSRKGARSQ